MKKISLLICLLFVTNSFASLVGTNVKITHSGNPNAEFFGNQPVDAGLEHDLSAGQGKFDFDVNTDNKTITFYQRGGFSLAVANWDAVFSGGDLATIDTISRTGGTLSNANLWSATVSNKTVQFSNPTHVANTGSVIFTYTSSTNAPRITSVNVPADKIYIAGNNLDFVVNTNKNITVTGTPRIAITIGSTTKYADFISGGGTKFLTFRYTLESGLSDTDGIALNSLDLNGGTLKDTSNNMNLTLNSVASTSNVKIDSIVPTISTVTVPTSGNYKKDDILTFTVNTNENITVTNTPRLELKIGNDTKYATYISGTGTNALVFKYTIESGLNINNGIEVRTLELNGGTLKDSAGNNIVTTLNNVGALDSIVVDSTLPTISSTSPADNSTNASVGANITITFSENIAKGTGNITLNKGATVVETFNIATGAGTNSGSVSISGTTLTLNPGSDLELNTAYHIEVPATAIDDSVGNSFAGILDDSTFNFTTLNNSSPTIHTNFTDLNISEDHGVLSYDINITDTESEDINLTVDSNDSTLATIATSWNGLLSASEYNSKTYDFNITFVPNAHGVASITINAFDPNGNSLKSFDINVSSVNDAPIIHNASKIVVYKNTAEKNVSINITDADKEDILYVDRNGYDTRLITSATFHNNYKILNIKPAQNISGNTDINLTTNDGKVRVTKLIKFIILPIEDGEDTTHIGDINTVEDSNGTTTTINVDDNLSIKTNEKNESRTYEVIVAGESIKATSDLNGSKTEVISGGVHTTYSDSNLSLEVNATMTGLATHTITTAGKTTKAISNYIGAKTHIKRINGAVQIDTNVSINANTNLCATAKSDGKAEHTVSVGSILSKVLSELIGAITTISTSGSIETCVNSNATPSVVGRTHEAIAVTDSSGNTITKFRETDGTNEYNAKPTLKIGSSFPVGSQTTISTDTSSVTHIQTTTPALPTQTSFVME